MSIAIRFLVRSVLLLAIIVWSPEPSTAKDSAKQKSTAKDSATVSVKGASSDWRGFPDSVETNSLIKLKVSNLYLLDRAAQGKIILFLDGMPLKGLYPVARDTAGEMLIFQFHRTDQSTATWDVLQKFGKPVREFNVSVGPENGFPVSSPVFMHFVFYDSGSVRLVAILLAALFVIFIIFAAMSDILRDPGPQPPPPVRKTFSLARVQMAWWFFVIFSSFVMIRLVTGELPSIPDSVLWLLGIASGTGLGAASIDVTRRSQALGKMASLHAQIATLTATEQKLQAVLNAQPPPTNPSDIQAELIKTQTALTQALTTLASLVQITQPSTSTGFLDDILSDMDGISFHRFQILAWTIVLGILFFLSALGTLEMVDYNATLLALMGISSGTYLGFKWPEKQT